MNKKAKNYIAKIIAKKLIEDEHKIRMAVLCYGTVIKRKSDGYVLTVEEMESLI
jgi:hypothetical protein